MFSIALKNNNSRTLSILLSLWVYTYALFYFVPLIIPSTTMLMYVWLIAIDILIVFNSRKLPIRLFGFLLAYIMIALINVTVVSYKYYAAIDAFSGMVVFLPALLIISSGLFNLNDFLAIWKKFAYVATIISPIAIILMQNRTIDYGVFTYLNLPNCIIFSYNIMTLSKGDKRKKVALIFDIANMLVILLFGGRMAAIAAAFSIFLAYMISSSVRPYKKVFIILLIGVAGIFVINNLNMLLIQLQVILNKYNLSSRSLSLLIEQMRTGGTGLYLTRRNIIYEEVTKYIVDRGGLPGGFGVSLNISNGQFYHPHNLFLQLAVMFGVIGGVLFVLLIIYRMIRIKKLNLRYEYQFTLLILVEYLVISFTGGSILNNFVAIIGIGMTFFYKGNQKNATYNYVIMVNR